MEGLSFGKMENKLGWNAQPTTAVMLDHVRVPESSRIGEEGAGFRIAMSGLDGGRINIGACSVGGAQFCLDYARDYVKGRKQFGHAIAEFQATQFKVADMATTLQVGGGGEGGVATQRQVNLVGHTVGMPVGWASAHCQQPGCPARLPSPAPEEPAYHGRPCASCCYCCCSCCCCRHHGSWCSTRHGHSMPTPPQPRLTPPWPSALPRTAATPWPMMPCSCWGAMDSSRWVGGWARAGWVDAMVGGWAAGRVPDYQEGAPARVDPPCGRQAIASP